MPNTWKVLGVVAALALAGVAAAADEPGSVTGDVVIERGEHGRIRVEDAASGQWRLYRTRHGRLVRLRYYTDRAHLPQRDLGPGGMPGSEPAPGVAGFMGSVQPRWQP